MTNGNPTARRVGTVAAAAAFALIGLSPLASAQTNDAGAVPNGLEITQHDNNARFVHPTGAKGANKLNFTQQVQKNSNWCWAAEGSSIEQYLGASTTQEEFCAAAKGGQPGSCPNQTGQFDEISKGFRNTGFQNSSSQSSTAWNEVKRQIDNNSPILTGIAWTAGGGHAETIYGYDESNQSLNYGDPWQSYDRYQTKSYNDYVRNAKFHWMWSYTNIHK